MKTFLRWFFRLIIAIFKRLLRGLLIVLGVLFVLTVVLQSLHSAGIKPTAHRAVPPLECGCGECHVS